MATARCSTPAAAIPIWRTGFFRNTPLGRLFPNNRFTTDYLMQDWDHATPRDVDWVSGAALMMRRDCWIRSALSTKISICTAKMWISAGAPTIRRVADGTCWRVAYSPEAVIYHLIGKSSDKVPTRMTYEFHRSQYLFYKKHYRATTPWLVRPLIPDRHRPAGDRADDPLPPALLAASG